ncbi:MAG: 4Fe-4S cluster-binding domain-containing protein [Candidatus Methanomethylicia archaeon]
MTFNVETIFAGSRKTYGVWELESRGKGMVIRYWGCNLKCPLCFAQSYAYRGERKSRFPLKVSLNEVLRQVGAEEARDILWCRIEGGEPLQSFQHMIMTVKLAIGILNLMKKSIRVIIQTNGIWLGKDENNIIEFCRLLKEEISKTNLRINGRIAVEISFKGPNLLAAKIYSGKFDVDILNLQIKAFTNLIKNVREDFWNKENYIVAVYPVAGFGPDLEKFTFIPLDPENKDYPLFHPKTWDQKYSDHIINFFKEVMNEYSEVYYLYKSRYGNRIAMYGLEPRNWQKTWTTKIKVDNYLKQFVLNYIRINAGEKLFNMFRKDFIDILDEINATDELMGKVYEICKFYACPEPLKHYPYL